MFTITIQYYNITTNLLLIYTPLLSCITHSCRELLPPPPGFVDNILNVIFFKCLALRIINFYYFILYIIYYVV